MPKLARPDTLPIKHRSWGLSEFEAMLDEALRRREQSRHRRDNPGRRDWDGVVLALALGRFAGWALGDIVHQLPSVWQNPRLVYVRRKARRKGRIVDLIAPDRLRAIFEEISPDPQARTLVTNGLGEPYTESGLRSVIHKLAADLVRAGKVLPGLIIHGLRHSLGKELYDLGLGREARKVVMAHESDAASKVYERDGDRTKQGDEAVRALNRHHAESRDAGN